MSCQDRLPQHSLGTDASVAPNWWLAQHNKEKQEGKKWGLQALWWCERRYASGVCVCSTIASRNLKRSETVRKGSACIAGCQVIRLPNIPPRQCPWWQEMSGTWSRGINRLGALNGRSGSATPNYYGVALDGAGHSDHSRERGICMHCTWGWPFQQNGTSRNTRWLFLCLWKWLTVSSSVQDPWQQQLHWSTCILVAMWSGWSFTWWLLLTSHWCSAWNGSKPIIHVLSGQPRVIHFKSPKCHPHRFHVCAVEKSLGNPLDPPPKSQSLPLTLVKRKQNNCHPTIPVTAPLIWSPMQNCQWSGFSHQSWN